MVAPICFFIDFVSTYSYFAARDIDEIARAHGRTVAWSVVSLPHVFQQAGTASPLVQPLKLEHNQQDVIRVAAMKGMPLRRPEGIPDVQWGRRVFWRIQRQSQDLANRFARICMDMRFGKGVELNTQQTLCVAADISGCDPSHVLAARDDEAASAALVQATAEAVSLGMFGAPFVRVGSERFWGHDRCTQHLDHWLRTTSVEGGSRLDRPGA